MVWDCFGDRRFGKLVKIDERVTKDVNLEILENDVVPTRYKLIGEWSIYHQGNDFKHTAKVVKAYLQDKSSEGILSLMQLPERIGGSRTLMLASGQLFGDPCCGLTVFGVTGPKDAAYL
ncbi:hypothetical protein Trydic_g5442 [Trypoxylus dichotomus]